MQGYSRYILAKKINRGGMAEIYLGKQIGEDGFQRLCAIKRILPHYAQDKEFIEMFRDEAHICKRLQHANIVRVEGFEEVEGSYAIVMEFVDGTDLRSLLSACEKSQQRLNLPMACFVAAEAARGLHYAHTKVDEISGQPLAIVHRDISPQNILISFEGEVKITDFGIADAGNKNTETKPGVVKGKYSYMSPEQISAKSVDARTDVFALAIVLWESLTMRRLFHGESEVETITLVKNCDIPSVREINPDIDEELEKILAKALEKDTKKRYQSAEAFERDLRHYISSRHPEYTSSDLAGFIKQVLAKRRDESQNDIKKILTETNLRPLTAMRAPTIPPTSTQTNQLVLTKDDRSTNLSVTGPRINRKNLDRAAATSFNPRHLSGNAAGRSGGQFTQNSAAYVRTINRGRKVYTLPFVAAALLVLAVSGFFVKRNMTAKEPMQILIRTTPALTRLELDGQPMFENKYKRTPLGIRLQSGKHTLSVIRQGYKTARFEFEGQGGETIRKDDLVLQAQATFAPTRVKFVGYGAQAPYFEIDQGYISGFGSMPIDDLIHGQNYVLTVYPEKIEGKDHFACQFASRARSWRDPLTVVVNVRSRNCTITGGNQ